MKNAFWTMILRCPSEGCGTSYREILKACPKCVPIPEGACQWCRGTESVRRIADEHAPRGETRCTDCSPLRWWERVHRLNGDAPRVFDGSDYGPRLNVLLEELEALRREKAEGIPIESLARAIFRTDWRVRQKVADRGDYFRRVPEGFELRFDVEDQAYERAWAKGEPELRREAEERAREIGNDLRNQAADAKGKETA